ncbi:MAG: class I SAM-dependent methyltransferase [Bacteroidales bacterium]|nr:class I SAM-dependent methyltransferase [Bacteroidales bacterium]
MGYALFDFQTNGVHEAEITVKSSLTTDDIIPVDYLFRNYDEFPEIERLAVNKANGRILDIGAGAGSHSLYLQSKGCDVTANDISTGSIEVMQERGVRKLLKSDFFEISDQKFDTLMLMMNGIGIVGDLMGLKRFLFHAKKLLNPGGQILLDSSDILYMFEEEDGSYLVDLNADYYGVVNFQMSYKEITGDSFNWLYVDFDTLKEVAQKCGFECELLCEDDHFQFLARLSI